LLHFYQKWIIDFAPLLSKVDNRFCSTFIKSGVNQMSLVQAEALELFRKKNADYGDAFATYGPIGVIVRMGDKINRLVSINQNGVTLVDSESVLNRFAQLRCDGGDVARREEGQRQLTIIPFRLLPRCLFCFLFRVIFFTTNTFLFLSSHHVSLLGLF